MKQMLEFSKHWRRSALLMILCGIAGFVVSLLIPNRFAATVFLSAGIDYHLTGTLDDLEEDRLFGLSEDIINSDEVLEDACGDDPDCTPSTLRKNMRISRTTDTWSLTILDRDPQKAARLASAWLLAADQALATAHQHALTADAYANEIESLTRCIHEAVNGVPPVRCEGDLSRISQSIERLSTSMESELTAARGLSSALRFGKAKPQHLQLVNASRSCAFCSLCGVLIGLLLAFSLVWVQSDHES